MSMLLIQSPHPSHQLCQGTRRRGTIFQPCLVALVRNSKMRAVLPQSRRMAGMSCGVTVQVVPATILASLSSVMCSRTKPG